MRTAQGGNFAHKQLRFALIFATFIISFVVIALATTLNPQAANISWTGNGDGTTWTSGANWQGGTSPGANDTAFINSGSNNIVIDQHINVGRIVVSSSFSGTITQQGNKTMTVGSSGITMNGGSFTGGDGAITVNGPFTLGSAGTAIWTTTSGTTDFGGNIIIGATGTFNHNSGSVVISESSSISIQNASVNDFNVLSLAASGKTTTLATDVYAAALTLSGGTYANSTYNTHVTGNGTIFTNASAATVSGAGDFYFVADGGDATIGALSSTADVDVFFRATGDHSLTLAGVMNLSSTSGIAVNTSGYTGNTATFASGNYAITAGEFYIGQSGSSENHGVANFGSSIVSLDTLRSYSSGSEFNFGSASVTTSGDLNLSVGTLTAGTSTITFTDPNSATLTANQGLNNLTFSGGGTYTLSQNTDINGTLTISDGILNLSSGNRTMNFAGDVTIGASGSITFGSGSIIFDGTTTLTDSAALTWQNVQTSGTAAVTQASSLTLDELSLAANTSWATAGNTFEIVSSLSNEGTVTVQGNETITLTPGNDTDSGTFSYTGRNASETLTIADFGATDYYILMINDANTNKATFNLADTAVLADDLIVTSGTLAGNGNTMTVGGDVHLNGGTVNSPTTLTVGGNWTFDSGTFTAADDTTVRFTGSPTITGANSFHHLSKTSGSGTITLPASTTQTIAGNLTLQGNSSNQITLNSASDGLAATLDVSGTTTLQGLAVKDITFTNGTNCFTACTDNGNNTNISFSAATTPTSPFAISCPALPNPRLLLTSVDKSDHQLVARFSADHGRAGTGIIVSTDPFFRGASWLRLTDNASIEVKLPQFNKTGKIYFIVRNLCYSSGVRSLTLSEVDGAIVSDLGESVAIDQPSTTNETTTEAINDGSTDTVDTITDEPTDDSEEILFIDEDTSVIDEPETNAPVVDAEDDSDILEPAELIAGMLLQAPQSPNIYYYSAQGLRHEFRSEDLFFTWYEDFSGITRVPNDQMNAIAFGRPVTASPGETLVKFAGSDRVYAVGFGGVLRWIFSPGMAASLFGTKWPELIQITNSIFFGDYLMGDPILNSNDYNPAREQAPNLDADLERVKTE